MASRRHVSLHDDDQRSDPSYKYQTGRYTSSPSGYPDFSINIGQDSTLSVPETGAHATRLHASENAPRILQSKETMSPLQKLALASYKYTTIKAAASEIRLLTLHPAPRHSDQPIISIQTTTLTDDHVPTYEGLSYAWGKWSTLEDILVLEKEVSRSRWFGSKKPIHSRLAVTPNLAEALRYLRLEDKERVFWIDAVCIDQKNLKERSEQVVRMGEVYTKAVRVVAWLGPEEGPIKGENESLGTKAGIKLLVSFPRSPQLKPRSTRKAILKCGRLLT